MADAAGLPEPIHGPQAVKSVAEEAKTTPFTELKREDLKWAALEGTNVECQTFYFFGENGSVVFAQVIFSNVAYEILPRFSSPPSRLVAPTPLPLTFFSLC